MRQKIRFDIMEELKTISWVRMQRILQTRNNKRVLIDAHSHPHFPIEFGNFLWMSVQFILSRVEFDIKKHHSLCIIIDFPEVVGTMDDGNTSKTVTLALRKVKGHISLITAHFGDTLEYFN